ncbi:unnamed protein product, partial [Symbiodinium pilosum]
AQMDIDGVVGLARARGARLCAAFREFDAQRTGVIHRTYLEALIHLSLARELSTAESQQLSNFLDKVTDKQENVEYESFVQWLYAPDSKLSELVLSRPLKSTTPLDPRPLSGRTLARIVRHKAASRPEPSRRGRSQDGKGGSPNDPRRGAMDPPRMESAWPSMGIARLSSFVERGIVQGPQDLGMPQSKMQPRYNFPRSRTRSSQGYRTRPRTPGKVSTPATEAPSVESGGYSGSGWVSPEELPRTPAPLLPDLNERPRQRASSQGQRPGFDVERSMHRPEERRIELRRQELLQENQHQQEMQEYHYRCQKLEREQAMKKEDVWEAWTPSQPARVVALAQAPPGAAPARRSSATERYEQQLQQELARQQQLELELQGDGAASLQWLQRQQLRRRQDEDQLLQQQRNQVRLQQEQADLALQRRQQEAETSRQRLLNQQRVRDEVLRHQQRRQPLLQDVSPAPAVDRAASPQPVAPLSPTALQHLPAQTAWQDLSEEKNCGANPQEAQGSIQDEEAVCKADHAEFVTYQEFSSRQPEAPRAARLPLRRACHEPRDLEEHERQQMYIDEERLQEMEQWRQQLARGSALDNHAVEVWHHQLLNGGACTDQLQKEEEAAKRAEEERLAKAKEAADAARQAEVKRLAKEAAEAEAAKAAETERLAKEAAE